jgi:hypothetical protein
MPGQVATVFPEERRPRSLRSCGKRGPYPVSHSLSRLDDDEHIASTSSWSGTPQSVQLKPVDLSKLIPVARIIESSNSSKDV